MNGGPPLALVLAAAVLCACAPADRRAGAGVVARARAEEAARRPPAPLSHDPFLAALPFDPVRLEAVLGHAPHVGTAPSARRLPEAEPEVRQWLAARGVTRIGFLHASGAALRVPAPPERVALALFDPEAEKEALGADSVLELASGTTGPRVWRRLSVAMLRMGEGPFRFDCRWTFVATRVGREGGRVLVRYDLSPAPDSLHVLGFHGAALLEPDGSGTRVAEVLVAASDLVPPFFLKGRAREETQKILTRRWERLAARLARP